METSKPDIKAEISQLLAAAEECKTDPNKYERIFEEINRKLPYGDKEVASVKHTFDETEIRVDYLSKRTKFLYDLEDYEDALKCSQELYGILPDHPKVLKGLGDCLRKLGKHDEAILQYDKAVEILGLDDENPSLHAHIRNNKALSLIEQKQFVNAVTALEDAISKDNQNPLYLVTLGKLYNQKKMEEKAVDNFIKASNLLKLEETQFDPINEKYLFATLPHVIQLLKQKQKIEDARKEKAKIAEMKKKMEEEDAILKKTNELVTEALNVNAKKTKVNIAEVHQKIEDQIVLQQDLENRVTGVEDLVAELRIQMAVFENVLQTKLDDFKKKIDLEISNPTLKARLLEYYEGFTKTFNLLCTTSLAIVSGQVPYNTGSTIGKAVSTLISFVDVLKTLGSVVNKLDDIWSSQEIKKRAIRITHLGSGNDVGQLVGEAAYKIILDEDYQLRIRTVTEESLKEHSDAWHGKLVEKVKNVLDKIEVKRHGELYPTAAAKLGNKDADLLVKKWLDEQIGNGNIAEEFKNCVIAQLNP